MSAHLRKPSRSWRVASRAVLASASMSCGCGGESANIAPVDAMAPSSDRSAGSQASEVKADGASASDNAEAIPDSAMDGLSDATTPPGVDGSMRCRGDSDCPQASTQYCVPCFEGGLDCAHYRCTNGSCVGVPAGRSCPGPLTNPCASKACGDGCQQCSTVDGGCYPGTCNWFGACKAATPVCTGQASRGCSPSDAMGVGDCNDFLGFGWDGSKCIALVGCVCQGSDCGILLSAEIDCNAVFAPCGHDAD